MLTRRSCVAAAFSVFVLGCLATKPSAPAALRDRELWYSIGDGQQAYGHMHLEVRRLEDGAAEYAVRSLIQIEVFGTRQELSSFTTALVEPDLSLRRLESDSAQMSGRTRFRLHATHDGHVLEREQDDGTTHTSTLARVDGLPIVSDLVLGDWLHRLTTGPGPAEPGLTRCVRLLVSETGEPAEATVQLVDRDTHGSTWFLDIGQEWQQTTLRFDANGDLVEQRVTTPPLHVTRASREQALAIDYRVMTDRELLVFPFDRELPPSRQLEQVDLELTWQDIPPAEFELEDARQHLLSLEERPDGCTAVVRLGRATDDVADTTLPLPRESFEATLGTGDFILPEDERIAATAAEIVGAETSARTATQRLCKWVNEFIQPAMIAETLSGPQVLERRVGKCTEYTTLFASLARAAGIPTRVVLGQRRFAGEQGDMWGGHMWNEVFIGQWIPVDASVNEVGGSLDLLKLVHSDTVAGTQPLRWKLTSSLEVSIAGFELKPAASGAVPTGLRGTLYTNAEYGFEVAVPDETWTLEATPATGALVLRMRPPDPNLGDAAMFHVTTFYVPKGNSPKLILDARLAQQRMALTEVNVLRDEDAAREGVTGHRITFGGVPKHGQPLRVSEVLLHHGETGVLVNLISTVDLHAELGPVFEQIVASVSFVE